MFLEMAKSSKLLKMIGVIGAILSIILGIYSTSGVNCQSLVRTNRLKMFVDEIPDVPKLHGYKVVQGKALPTSLTIGMFQKFWKFHRDLPSTPVFAFGRCKKEATIPGPTIEALHGVDTYITWENNLPKKHLLPWDPTIPTAVPRDEDGVPTVVHLHGGINEPESDGHSHAWFTKGFKQKGPRWTKKTYHYHNHQHPGSMWYHDHAMGLTRANILAGLVGSYIVRHPQVEDPLHLPNGDFDKVLVVCDRDFYTNGSIYMNTTGNNPKIHPEWQPEYFGDVIVVNGKAWPYMEVERRKYRFRIINTSNARFFRFYLTNGLPFIHIASDSAYLHRPTFSMNTLVAPSEIAGVIIDFSRSNSHVAFLANDAAYPFPSGDPVNEANSMVIKFIIKPDDVHDPSQVPKQLIKYPSPKLSSGASRTRYIAMYEYTSKSEEPTHLYINGLSYEAPVTETPKVGSTEIWYVMNLTEDNHPLHIHVGLFKVLKQTKLLGFDEFQDCMTKKNDAEKCAVHKHARGHTVRVPKHERGWKNVYKMKPGYMTKIYLRFSYIHVSNVSYPFDATKEPGYVYHCHILDHEDNVMMRPFKLVK